jgi:hypothetical protein
MGQKSAVDVGRLIPEGVRAYPESVRKVKGTWLALVKTEQGKFIFLSRNLKNFSELQEVSKGYLAPLSPANAAALMDLCPELRPRRLPAGVSFGFGDRIGGATPGHLRALAGADVFPVLAQQSVRELTRTGRNFQEVLATAVFGALQEGYGGGFGADADHLKTVDQAREAARAGYTMFTCDPSQELVSPARLPEEELEQRYHALPERERWEKEYLGKNFQIKGLGRLRFSLQELVQVAVKFSRAIELACEMYAALKELLPQGFDFELSLDEAEAPTTPAEHYFVVSELAKRDVVLTGLAPRFGGVLEKAVDYRGSLEVFRRDLRAHVALANVLGPYRISLHSGSDKFSLYPVLAREGGGRWHVKTAGTSYLVALGVVAEKDPQLLREIWAQALKSFATDRESYHLAPDLSRLPSPQELPEQDLPSLLTQDDPRQVLHVTFGSVLRGELGDRLRQLLADHEEDYYRALAEHLGRHLVALGVKKDG